jgi:hypothetical protein
MAQYRRESRVRALGHARGVRRCFRFRRVVEDLEMLGLKDLPVEPVVLDLVLAEVALRVGP